MTLLALEGVVKAYDGRTLLAGVDLAVGEGERVGLLGPNGSGKSTILRILAGLETPDAGARVQRKALRLGYLEQEPVLDGDLTARDAVRAGIAGREEVLAELARVHEELGATSGDGLERLMRRQARLEEELERLGGHDVEHRIESVLTALGVTDFEARCATLSGGERRRVALARCLTGAPELLLLDEPTNHLDAFAVDWMEDWFLETRTPLLVVTHDRYFLDRVCDRIVELDRGKLHGYAGGYAEYLEARAARLSAEARAEDARLNLLRRETAWMRRGPPARTTKAKARIRRYEELAAGAPEALARDLELALPSGPRLGARVVTLRGATKRFGGRTVVPPIDLELAPGERLGVVGPNGAGKTTLLRLILGELPPDRGTVELGSTVQVATMDQARAGLAPERRVTEVLAGKSDVVAVGGRTVRVESWLDRFGLGAAQARALVRDLSGGERARLELARLFAAGANVLVLDEPTNDLDLGALRALEEALLAFEGSALVVSHDRWFLDRVASRILCLDGAGGLRVHRGDVSALLADLAREAAERRAAEAASARPAPAPSSAAKPAAKARRITPWQERELAELEAHIAALEAELAAVDARLADPGLWTGPKDAAVTAQGERTRLAGELERSFARWEELESLRQ